MERALDAVADNLAAVADVGAQVLAVPFQHMKLAGLVAVGGEVLAEVASAAVTFADLVTRPTSRS